jgi:hypothetical protein
VKIPWYDNPDEDAFERGRRQMLWDEAHTYVPRRKIRCRHCGEEVPYVLAPSGKRLLLHPGTGVVWHGLSEYPGGNYIVVTSPDHGHVIAGNPTKDTYPKARFYEHHNVNCRVIGRQKRREQWEARTAYREELKRKYNLPSAPDYPPADLDQSITDDLE